MHEACTFGMVGHLCMYSRQARRRAEPSPVHCLFSLGLCVVSENVGKRGMHASGDFHTGASVGQWINYFYFFFFVWVGSRRDVPHVLRLPMGLTVDTKHCAESRDMCIFVGTLCESFAPRGRLMSPHRQGGCRRVPGPPLGPLAVEGLWDGGR